MNIAVFTKRTTFHKGFGGLETQNKILCEGLSRRGHSVIVFAPKWEFDSESLHENDVTYFFVESSFRSFFGFSSLQKKNWENRSVEKFKELNDKNPFDIALSQSSAGLGIIKNKNELKIPVISISHGTISGEIKTRLQNLSLNTLKDIYLIISDIGYFLLNFFFRQRTFIRNSDRVVAVSKVVKKALIDETFVPDNKIEVIYNGLVPPEFPEHVEIYSEPRVLYVGRVDRSKGLDDLLESINDSSLSDVRIDIIGNGDYIDSLKKFASKNNMKDRVHFMGAIPHEEVLNHMHNADIFVLPSKRVEGFPMTLVEAMFAGLPIIGSDMGGIPESIIHGLTGIVYKSGDVNALREALVTLTRDIELRKSMGEWAREKAYKNYTVDVMLDNYEKIMKEVIS